MYLPLGCTANNSLPPIRLSGIKWQSLPSIGSGGYHRAAISAIDQLMGHRRAITSFVRLWDASKVNHRHRSAQEGIGGNHSCPLAWSGHRKTVGGIGGYSLPSISLGDQRPITAVDQPGEGH